MKVVFSRKGWDSSAGGFPSPIVDGRPLSLPIPSGMPSNLRFGDLNEPLPSIVEHVSKGRTRLDGACHLDPDIDVEALADRPKGWRGALGQVSSSQAHLANHGVGPGDIFLFWGLFAEAARVNGTWRYIGRSHHRLFGWLEIDQVVSAGPDGSSALANYPWLRDHPHARDGWGQVKNTIYIARKHSSVAAGRLGYGVLAFGRQLTADLNGNKSVWKVPEWLHPASGGTRMSYHFKDKRWLDELRLQSAGRGQEFVADIGDRSDAKAWIRELIQT